MLVAAGSMVTKSIPDGVVVAGNPAKYICSVEEYIEKNKAYNINTKKMNNEEKKIYSKTVGEIFHPKRDAENK